MVMLGFGDSNFVFGNYVKICIGFELRIVSDVLYTVVYVFFFLGLYYRLE